MIESLDFGPVGNEEAEEVERLLADHCICSRCGAALPTYADKCNAPLDAPCPGFLTVEGARLHLRRSASRKPAQESVQ